MRNQTQMTLILEGRWHNRKGDRTIGPPMASRCNPQQPRFLFLSSSFSLSLSLYLSLSLLFFLFISVSCSSSFSYYAFNKETAINEHAEPHSLQVLEVLHVLQVLQVSQVHRPKLSIS